LRTTSPGRSRPRQPPCGDRPMAIGVHRTPALSNRTGSPWVLARHLAARTGHPWAPWTTTVRRTTFLRRPPPSQACDHLAMTATWRMGDRLSAANRGTLTRLPILLRVLSTVADRQKGRRAFGKPWYPRLAAQRLRTPQDYPVLRPCGPVPGSPLDTPGTTLASGTQAVDPPDSPGAITLAGIHQGTRRTTRAGPLARPSRKVPNGARTPPLRTSPERTAP
jgi:hypothetical protein